MGAAELKPAVIRAALGVLGLTAVGAVAGLIAPGLGGHTPPHPTLTGSVSDALNILSNNARLLCVPFLLAGVRFADSRPGRVIGDAAMIVLTAVSAVTVGIALGRWRGRLIPYLPHLPLEWAALTAAGAAWLLVRTGHAPTRQLVALGAVTLVLLCAAAVVETWATPHLSERTRRRSIVDARGLDRAGRLMRPRDCAGAASSPTHVFCFSRRREPSAPAIAGPSSTTDPLGGITA